jgi:hypothetical protein
VGIIDISSLEKGIYEGLESLSVDVLQALELVNDIKSVGEDAAAVERLKEIGEILDNAMTAISSRKITVDSEALDTAIHEELDRILVSITRADMNRVLEIGKPKTPEESAEVEAIVSKILPSPFLDNLDFSSVLKKYPLTQFCVD